MDDDVAATVICHIILKGDNMSVLSSRIVPKKPKIISHCRFKVVFYYLVYHVIVMCIKLEASVMT